MLQVCKLQEMCIRDRSGSHWRKQRVTSSLLGSVDHEYLHDRGSPGEHFPIQKTFSSIALMYRGNHPIDRYHDLDVVSHPSIRE